MLIAAEPSAVDSFRAPVTKTEELEAVGYWPHLQTNLRQNKDPQSPANRANFERALKEYQSLYLLNTQETWPGINVVALAARAKFDKLQVAGLPDSTELAREILATIANKEADSAEPLKTWDVGTRLEAFVALGQHRMPPTRRCVM